MAASAKLGAQSITRDKRPRSIQIPKLLVEASYVPGPLCRLHQGTYRAPEREKTRFGNEIERVSRKKSSNSNGVVHIDGRRTAWRCGLSGSLLFLNRNRGLLLNRNCLLLLNRSCVLLFNRNCILPLNGSVLCLNYNCIKRIAGERSCSVSALDDIRQNNRREYNKNNCRYLLTLCLSAYY